MLFAMDWAVAERALWTAWPARRGWRRRICRKISYKRYRDLSTARQELLKNIDEFSHALCKPRKLYQVMIDGRSDLLPDLCTHKERDGSPPGTIHQALADLVAATGRFRTFQVEIIRLYGYNMDLLSHYLAIWRYLKDTRRRMERGASLYYRASSRARKMRSTISSTCSVSASVWPALCTVRRAAAPPENIIAEMRRQGDEVFDRYFGLRRTGLESSEPMHAMPEIAASLRSYLLHRS